MGWCHEHLGGCIFAGESELPGADCPEERGTPCTLVHVILAVHRLPPPIRRRLIAALYPAYGIQTDGASAGGAPGAARPPRGRKSESGDA